MSLLHYVVLFGLLHNICDVQAFTVELPQPDNTGYEGEAVDITVRLDGQIFGNVGIELQLMTLNEFLNSGMAPNGFSLAKDPAENNDFTFDGTLTHTFHAVSALRQTTTFHIDLVNDDRNEFDEQFIVVVGVTSIQNEVDDIYEPDDSERLFATVTIEVDPSFPDMTKLEITPNGLIAVTETTTEFTIQLTITEFAPENDLEISIGTEETSTVSATPTSDYVLLNSSITLTSNEDDYFVSIEFVDNDVPERDLENFKVTFQVASGDDIVTFDPAGSLTITIMDDDVLQVGFSETEVEIKEGQSSMVNVLIISPDDVEVSVSLDVILGQQGTANDDEIQGLSRSLTLGSQNKEEPIVIDIPDNDVIDEKRERQFTLKLIKTSYFGSQLNINPQTLRVIIKDNDTEIEFGILSPDSEVRMIEGESITFTVGFTKDDLQLDDDFRMTYSVNIQFETATSEDFLEEKVDDGELSNSVRSQDFTIETKDNDFVQENRKFTVFIALVTSDFNSPLIKVSPNFTNVAVIIEDNDFGIPNKPIITGVTPLTGNKEFVIEWSAIITEKQPIEGYFVVITFPDKDGVTTTTVSIEITDPQQTSLTHEYIIDGVDYSTANISVEVCAYNNEGTVCSEPFYHQGVEVGGGETSEGDEDGINGGAIAAIIIILLLLCIGIPVILLLLFLCNMYCWRTYYPGIREKDLATELTSAREEFGDDV